MFPQLSALRHVQTVVLVVHLIVAPVRLPTVVRRVQLVCKNISVVRNYILFVQLFAHLSVQILEYVRAQVYAVVQLSGPAHDAQHVNNL